jgi:hypothetical protein
MSTTMVPDNIAKEHLLLAIKEIDVQGVRKGRHSSTYDLVFQGNMYPPKLVISIANRFANGVELEPSEFPAGMETPAFKLLIQEGFKIVPKQDPAKSLIEKYKSHIQVTRLKDELYKWELIREFEGRPDTKADNFQQEIKNLKFSNLAYHMSIAVLNHIAQENIEGLRQIFETLFDEKQLLGDRIAAFTEGANRVYLEINPNEKDHHYQDERSIATYLTFHNPQKYTLYKAGFYKKYCDLIGEPVATKNKKYVHYMVLVNDFITKYIEPDKELINQVKSLMPEYYNGTNHLLLAQDILYQTLEKKNDINYWVFQGNPDVYDFKTALKENLLTDWSIRAHKNKIAVGDKVIIWLTGDKSGCYALADITSEPQIKESSPDDHLWKENQGNDLKANLKITHNLIDNPIGKSMISELTELKVGNQGTNFSATKDEYETVRRLAEGVLSNGDSTQQYWLYAPGTNAELWDDFYNAGIMGLGWDDLGDLDDYSSKEEITQKLQALEGTKSSKKNDATANYEFRHDIEIGDVIIVKKGRGILLGYGVVLSEYYYDNNRGTFQKCRKVEWKLKGSWQVEHTLALKTLTNLTGYDSSNPKYEKYYEQLLALMKGDQLSYNYKSDFAVWLNNKYPKTSGTASSYLKAIDMLNEKVEFNIYEVDDLKQLENLYAELIEEQRNVDGKYYFEAAPSYSTRGFFSASVGQYIMFLKESGSIAGANTSSNYPLNMILYGPPGTGKTYRLKNDFFARYTSSEVTVTRDEYLKNLCASLAWWEVIALAVLDMKRAKVSDIFQHELVQHKSTASNSKSVTPTIWGQLQSHTIEECEFVNVSKRFQILIFNKTENSEWEVILEKVEEQVPELLTLKDEIDTYQPLTKTKKRYVFTTFHQSYSYEDFIEGIKPIVHADESSPENGKQVIYEIQPGLFRQIVDEALEDPNNNYAIFIDEINRGNIANIFGELITLIEDDKRIGMDNYIPAKLPYSGDEFGVPPNLHIFGTMNTADRSVEALDTALRRRFSFIEVNPEPELLNQDIYKCDGINLANMLYSMNGRLEKLLDKDYCIGHSYFMSIHDRKEPLEELRQTFVNKILPLLQEYFYGDWGKIGLVIGNGFVKKEVGTVKFLSDGIDEEYEEYIERPVYRFTNPEDWNLATFTSIYE